MQKVPSLHRDSNMQCVAAGPEKYEVTRPDRPAANPFSALQLLSCISGQGDIKKIIKHNPGK
jgi:hypothetical protein